MTRRLPAIPAPVRERALALAEEVGPAEAARRMNLNAATLRSWRAKAGQTAPRVYEDPHAWADRKEQAAAAWDGAQEALARVRQFVRKGQAVNARGASIAYGILIDKGLALEQAARTAREADKRLALETGQTIIKLWNRVLDNPEFGLNHDQKRVGRRVLADEMRALGEGRSS
jgi:hypothetical protein